MVFSEVCYNSVIDRHTLKGDKDMKDDMRGLFFIVKGQYKKGVRPSFVNSVSGDVSYIGGYDPYNPNTENWYMLLDCKTFHCVACGCDLEKVLKSVHTVIVKSKGVGKRYFKHVSSITSDDYYEVHYLGRRPLTPEQRAKKAEGRCPRVSPIMRCLYEHIYEEYGDFFSDEIKKMEDLAYKDLKESTPVNKSRKLVSKTKPKNVEVKIEPPKKEVYETPTLKLKVKPKKKIKKLSI